MIIYVSIQYVSDVLTLPQNLRLKNCFAPTKILSKHAKLLLVQKILRFQVWHPHL